MNKINLMYHCLFALLMVIAGCTGSTSVIEDVDYKLTKLQQAKTKWNNQAGDYYTYNYQRSCFCITDSLNPLNVTVINNKVLTAYDTMTLSVVSPEVKSSIKTIADAFDLIESAILTGADSLVVEYDAALGYPKSIAIDYSFAMADDEISYSISEVNNSDIKNALDDVSWQLVSFNTIAGPQSPIEGTSITLFFNPDTLIFNGNTGCNGYSGEYQIGASAGLINVSYLINEEMACETPEGVMDQESNYLAGLAAVRSFFFDETGLQLVIGADNVLQFEILEAN